MSDPNIDYYKSESYNQSSKADEFNKSIIQLITVKIIKTIQTLWIKYRHCKNTFESNNRLHYHFWNIYLKGKPTAFVIDILNKLILNIFNYFITLNDIIILSVAISTVLTIKKVGTGFGFWNWHYVITKVHLMQ